MLRGVALVFLARNFQKLAALAIQVMIARVLTQEEARQGVGVYALLVQTPTIVATLASVGLGPAHVHFRGQGTLTVRQVLGNGVAGSLLFGLAALAVFTLARPWLQLDLGNPLLITLVSFSFPVTILISYLDYLWIGEDRMGTYSALYGLRYLLLPFLLLVAITVPGSTEGKYLGMAIALVANGLLSLTASLLAVRREYGLGLDFRASSFGKAVRYGAHIQAGSAAQAIGYRFDYFLINGFINVGALGLYTAATNVAEALWILPATVSTALLPRVATKDLQAAQSATARTCRVVFTISVLAGAGVFVLAELLLTYVYRPSFASAAPALRWLLVGTVVFSLQKVLANYFIGQGKAKWFLWATISAMVVNLGINLVLIPREEWGIVGAALASAVSYTFSTVVLAVLFLRWSGLRPLDILVPKRADISVVGARMRGLIRSITARRRSERAAR